MVDNELQNMFYAKLIHNNDKVQLIQDIYDSFNAATTAKEKEEDRTRVFVEDMKEFIIADIEKNRAVPADVGYMAALVFVREYPMATKETLEEVAESAIKDVYGDI